MKNFITKNIVPFAPPISSVASDQVEDYQPRDRSAVNIFSPCRQIATTARRFILIGIAFLTATLTLKADECADILKQGIFDELNLTKSGELVSTFKSLLSMDVEKLERTSKDEGKEGRLALSILKLINVEAGGTKTSKEQKLAQLSQSFQTSQEAFFQSSEFAAITQRTVNESIVNAWRDCVTNQGRFVIGWYADDPLDAGRVTVKFAKPGPENRTKIPITSVTTNNLFLLPQEKVGFFGGKAAPAIRAGKSIRLNETVSAAFERADPDKPASIIVSFGSHGDVDLRFPARPIVQIKDVLEHLERDVSIRVEKIGGKLISGGDRDMDTDPSDVVTCTFSSDLKFDDRKVWISADYTCEEYRGDHTKLGAALTDKILFTAPPNLRIVGLKHAGHSAFSKNPRIRGRNHGFVEVKLPNETYWKSLDFRVDSSSENDAPRVGFKGVVAFTVELQSR